VVTGDSHFRSDAAAASRDPRRAGRAVRNAQPPGGPL